MRKFKTIDLYINIVLIVFFIFWIFLKRDTIEGIIGNPVFTAYFVIGGWQIISMLAHAFTGTFVNSWGSRYVYHWVTFVSIVTMPAGSFWILAITAPFMALFYTWLCYHEVHVKMKRPLADLK